MLRTLQRDRSGPSIGRSPRTKLLAMVAALALLVPIGIGLGSAMRASRRGATQTVDRSPDALLLSVRDIADYHAAPGTYQVLVDVEQETPRLPSAAGQRAIDAVRHRVGGRPRGLLPAGLGRRHRLAGRQAGLHPPACAHARPGRAGSGADPGRRQAAGLDAARGRRDQRPAQDDSQLYAIASAKLNAAAAQSDLTTRAADNTRSMLTGMAKSFGYDAVTVTFDPPAPPAAP